MFYIDTYENATLHCSVRVRFLADIFPLLGFRVVDTLHDCHVLETIVIFVSCDSTIKTIHPIKCIIIRSELIAAILMIKKIYVPLP